MMKTLRLLLIGLLLATVWATPSWAGGPDGDGDGTPDGSDNCEYLPNADQADTDVDGLGDVCDYLDLDDDGDLNTADNCPFVPNDDQADVDGDGIGDECDGQDGRDLDDDGVFNHQDTCPFVSDPNNDDTDGDGLGDVCDPRTEHKRTVSIALTKHVVLKGTLSLPGGYVPCTDSVSVKVQRMKAGGWSTVKTINTGDHGSYETTVADKEGKYRVLAPELSPSTHICRKAVSQTKTHKH